MVIVDYFHSSTNATNNLGSRIKDLNVSYIYALLKTAPNHQIRGLREAIWGHVVHQTSIRVFIPVNTVNTTEVQSATNLFWVLIFLTASRISYLSTTVPSPVFRSQTIANSSTLISTNTERQTTEEMGGLIISKYTVARLGRIYHVRHVWRTCIRYPLRFRQYEIRCLRIRRRCL
jgi:hypothetical protein